MTLRQWKLQDAKNHFSELVECAMNDGPQEVTKRVKNYANLKKI